MSERDELILRCDCGCGRYISVGSWPDDADPAPYFCVEYEPCECWRCRLKRAWHALGGDGHRDTEVLLTPATARRIIAAIRRHARLEGE